MSGRDVASNVIALPLTGRSVPAVVPDHLSEAGARRLGERIEGFWAEKGWRVRASVEPMGRVNATHKKPSFRVVSDMINGLPRSRHPK